MQEAASGAGYGVVASRALARSTHDVSKISRRSSSRDNIAEARRRSSSMPHSSREASELDLLAETRSGRNGRRASDASPRLVRQEAKLERGWQSSILGESAYISLFITCFYGLHERNQPDQQQEDINGASHSKWSKGQSQKRGGANCDSEV